MRPTFVSVSSRPVKAIVKARPEPGLDIVEIDEPQIAPGCVKLRVEQGSVCGTDLHIFKWDHWAQGRIHPPRVIGHEFCGTVVEVGPDVPDRTVGQFVSSESHIVDLDDPDLAAGLGHVARTTRILGVDTDGGFAPYAVVPWQNARPVPNSVPREVASMLDALGNAVHTVMDGPVEGRTVLITGLGPIGLFAVAVCKSLGAQKVYGTEVSPYRKAIAEQMGIDMVLDPTREDVETVLSKVAQGGVDATLEMSGHPSSLDLALGATRPGGRVSLLGVYADILRAVDFNRVVFKGLQMHGIVGRKLWETWDQMTWLLTEKGLDVRPVITHTMEIGQIEEAMVLLSNGQAGKVVLRFST